MKFHRVIIDVCGSKAKSHVLDVLLRFPAKTWTGRELAAEASISTPQAIRALRVFESYGIVESQKAGSSQIWSLSHGHVLVNLLTPLTHLNSVLTEWLLDGLRRHLVDPKLKPISSVTLFGSVARGDERAGSDVDLLVIVKSDKDKTKVNDAFLKLTIELQPVLGNSLQWLILSMREYPGEKNQELVRNIEKEGYVLYSAGVDS